MVKSEGEKKARKILDTLAKVKTGKIRIDKAFKIINEYGIDPEYLSLGEQQQVTAFIDQHKKYFESQYAAGDNANREKGFKHNPSHSVKGRFFQDHIKHMIRKAIHLSHWWIVKKYDKDAFVYDDPRMKALDTFIEEFIDKHFQQRAYHLEIMHQIRNIALFIPKEDVNYASPFFVFINKFVKEFPDGFELTEKEKYNFRNFHMGTAEEVQKRERISKGIEKGKLL